MQVELMMNVTSENPEKLRPMLHRAVGQEEYNLFDLPAYTYFVKLPVSNVSNI